MKNRPLSQYGVNDGVSPKGGWFFDDVIKSHPVRIPTKGSANSSAHLIELVNDFRIRNGIETDSTARDIASQILARSPISKRGTAKELVSVREKIPQIKRIKRHIEELSSAPAELVSEFEAKERAKVCANCPQNIKWESDCGGCNKQVVSDVMRARRLTKFGLDAVLRSCRLTGHHLGLSVFLADDALPTRTDNFPEKCWVKNKS